MGSQKKKKKRKTAYNCCILVILSNFAFNNWSFNVVGRLKVGQSSLIDVVLISIANQQPRTKITINFQVS